MNVLPTGWESVELDDACELIRGITFPTAEKRFEFSVGMIGCLRTANVQTTVEWDDLWFVPRQYVKQAQQIVAVDDILISTANSYELVGKVSRVTHIKFDSTLGAFISLLRAHKGIDAGFLYYQMTSEAVQQAIREMSSTTTNISNVSGGKLKTLELVIAPVAEQTRIVDKLEELLSGLDAGVAELKAAQKKLAQYRQSLLKAAVEGALTAEWRANNKPAETGAQLLERILQERRVRWEAKQLTKFKEQGKAPPKDWQKKYPEPVQPEITDLPELPQGWVWASVEQLSESVRNGLSKTPNTEQRGFPIFKINAVRPMVVNFTAIKHIEIDESEAADYWVEVGDVLATRYNGSVDLLGVFGMVKTVPERTLHPDKLIRMKPLTGAELGAWMEVCGNVGLSRKHLVARVKTTAGQTGISGEDLKRTPIPLPPVAEQKIALAVLEERLQVIRELELPTELGLKQSTAQRQNILKAAFSGQLVPQDPSDEPASELLKRIRAERAAQQAVKKPRGRKAKEAA